MRTIEWTSAFRKDYKRTKATPKYKDVPDVLAGVVEMLATDRPLPKRYRDHRLAGNWDDHRECHLRPDLLLIYKKPDDSTLRLVRMGSHSELFK